MASLIVRSCHGALAYSWQEVKAVRLALMCRGAEKKAETVV
jgi:hypothetical protein